MLLIYGGSADPQIRHFQNRVAARGLSYRALLHGADNVSSLTWDLSTGRFHDDEGDISFSSAFVRQDVFRFLSSGDQRDRDDGASWKTMIDGVLRADPSIRMFNRGFAGQAAVNKPLALLWAREAGLAIPDTVINASTSHAETLLAEPTVYKPIVGGDMCRPLEAEALARVTTRDLKRPYIFQERLDAPELRVFRVGGRFFGFDVAADALDYRSAGKDVVVTPKEVPEHLIAPLRTLTDRIGLTYAAADLKYSPRDDKMKFLEVNSNPMFVGFDKSCDYELVDAMIDHLTEPQ